MWLKCSACRAEIGFGEVHWICSVSTCNRSRTRLVFCSVSCWDSHVAMLRHRDAWAVEERSPTAEQWQRELAAQAPESGPTTVPRPAVPVGSAPTPVVRRIVAEPAPSPTPPITATDPILRDAERDMMIVISKLKKYIKDRSGFNCSDAVGDVLSENVRALCDEAIRAAARDERKTVLDRDVPRPRR